MKPILFTPLFLITLVINADAQEELYRQLISELHSKHDEAVLKPDSSKEGTIWFQYPALPYEFGNRVIKQDRIASKEDKLYTNATITYSIKQCSPNFISAIKHIYVEAPGSARGFSAWDQTINMLLVENKQYAVNYRVDSNIYGLLKQAATANLLELECLQEEVFPLENVGYFFEKGLLYIHKPIVWDGCEIDLECSFSQVDIQFTKR